MNIKSCCIHIAKQTQPSGYVRVLSASVQVVDQLSWPKRSYQDVRLKRCERFEE